MSHIEDLALEIDYLRGDLAKRDAEIEDKEASLDKMRSKLGERETLLRRCREENKKYCQLREENERLYERVQEIIDASGQECGCGYDKQDDVCLGHWPACKKQQNEIKRLQRLLMRSTHDGQRLLDALNDIANRGVPVQREEHRIARAALAEVKDA